MIELALPGARVLFTGREEGDVRAEPGRARVRALTGREPALGHQVHGSVVHRVGSPMPTDGEEADGQATARSDVAPAVLVADCLPIAVAGAGAVAMLHGGWRGLAGGVVEEGVRALRELGEDGRLVAAIGPGARACCYEVGDEVHRALGVEDPSSRMLDLPAIARQRLLAAGVERVEDLGVCTICDGRFFSHRADGPATGRQAGVVWRA